MTGKVQVTNHRNGCDIALQQRFTPKQLIRRSTIFAAAAILAGSVALGGCGGGVVTQHGYIASETALEQIQIGSSKEQVRLIMGTPTTSAAIGDNVYFYVSETKEQLYFFKPKTIDRRILTFHFDEEDRVSRIANYGLKDGVVFDFISRKTPTRGDELTALRQLLGNFGNLGVEQ